MVQGNRKKYVCTIFSYAKDFIKFLCASFADWQSQWLALFADRHNTVNTIATMNVDS